MSGPFFSPWDILVEGGPIMVALREDFKASVVAAEAIPNPTLVPVENWWMRIHQCSWKLPHVHEGIVKMSKISQGGGCCGVSDLCELLFTIDEMRPATKEKFLDSAWRTKYEEKIHEVLCCIQNIESASNVMAMNTFPHITEIPPHSLDGMPGFRYPNYRIPPITRLIRPHSYRLNTPSEEGSDSSDMQAPNKGREHEKKPFLAYNVDGKDRVLGVINTINERHVSTPFKSPKSIVVDEKGTQIDFDTLVSKPIVLPNISVKPHRTVVLDEEVSQFIPAPMFMPVNEISYLSLGDGEEFGIYDNYTLGANNFGTQFKANTNVIAPLVKTDPFARNPVIADKGQTGIDRSQAAY